MVGERVKASNVWLRGRHLLGFPRPEPTPGMYDLVKINQWVNVRNLSIAPENEDEAVRCRVALEWHKGKHRE